jgi:hypothetical protein
VSVPAEQAVAPDYRPARSPSVIAVELDGEAVLYLTERDEMHLLNPLATVVWNIIDGQAPVSTLADELAEAFGADVGQVLSDLTVLLGQLDADGLVTDSRTPTVGVGS